MVLKNTYVVSNEGKDIQELFDWIRDTLEKRGVVPLFDILKTLFDVLKAQVYSYALLEIFEEWLAKITDLLREWLGLVSADRG